MRILAIRGKNLASLANEFEIQLEQGVLQSTGLFAITGPTGSGKSTILDAICLALYDKMPRLPDGHSVFIGHKDEDESIRVKSNDVSSILRRGTASAYAEVDFLGKDKQSYRARWEISRARGKVSGKLQAQKVSLQNLVTAEKIGEGKKATLQAIEQCIGLNFDQFRRSVLLAQGDFAAFLKAKKDDRSNLLEKITGTDIYSELSIAAFERAKNEKQALDKISEKLVDKTPLNKEERLVLEKESQNTFIAVKKLQGQIKQTQETLKWFATYKILKQDEIKAQQAVQQTQLNWDASQDDRKKLQWVEQVQPLRPLLQHTTDLAQELIEADNTLKGHQNSLIEAEKQQQQINKQLEQAENNYLDVVKQHKATQPLLQQARQLDTQIESSIKLLDEVNKNTQHQQLLWEAADSQLKVLQQQKAEKELVKQQSQIWQEKHAAIEELARQWERWENELKGYIENQQIIEKLNIEKSTVREKLADDKKNLIEKQNKEAKFLQKKNELSDTIEQLKKQFEQYSLSDIHQQKQLVEQQITQIESACSLAEKGLELHSSHYQDQQGLLTVEQNIQQINDRTPKLLIELQQKQAQLDEAQIAFNLIQAASQKTAKDLRHLLQQNEPCPVCGSEEHPWENSELANTINQSVEEQKKRLSTLNKEKDRLIAEKSQNNSEYIQLVKDKSKLSVDIKNTTERLKQLAGKWSECVFDDKPEWVEILKSDEEKFKQLNIKLKADYAEIKLKEEQVLARQKQLDLRRAEFDQVTEKYTKQKDQTAKADSSLAKRNTELTILEKELARIEILQLESIELLTSPFKSIENWQLQLTQNGKAFVQQMAKDVRKWQETEDELSNIESQLIEINTQFAVAVSENEQQQTLLQKADKDLLDAKHKKQVLVDKRSQFFEGQAADIVSEKLEQQLQQADTEKQKNESDIAVIKLEITSCKGAVNHWLKEQQRRSKNNTSAEQQLDLALKDINLDKKTLQEFLGKNNQWIEAQNIKFKDLTIQLQEATATLKVKNQQLIEHQKNTPDIEEPTLLVQIEQLNKTLESLEQEKENNSFALRSDDEKIKLGKALHHQLQDQTKCWEKWESLNELIGSSNGQKFRIFAQSLTLETLLSYTNSHLKEFAKRYHLQRVPGSDLELQVVDRDMADEVRSVHGLSGGESFLVSLALALGLASLSSNKIQVESLFIDEGFGSLDPETLDIAIASLDTLQSLGRKVGVISHVPVLVERIGAKIVVEKMGGGQSKVSIQAY